jgi:PPOX class probable F420-dependent enzyme
MATIPGKYLDLFTEKKAFASLATLMPDGTPQVTPVWFGYEKGKLTVNTALGRTKAKNMKQGASVSLAILDPDNPYRYVQVRGRVAGVTTDGADQHIDRLSHKYMGRDYPFRQPGDQRVIVEIEPVAVSASG